MFYVEIISGLWIGDSEIMNQVTFLKDHKIGIILNCSDIFDFPSYECQKIRIPLPSNHTNETKVGILRGNYKKITKLISDNLCNENILLSCSDGKCISPLLVALYLKDYGKLPIKSIYEIILTKDPSLSLWCDLSSFS